LPFGGGSLAGSKGKAAEISQTLVAPHVLLDFALMGELAAKTRGGSQEPYKPSVREVFEPFHRSILRFRWAVFGSIEATHDFGLAMSS
jgi:hypothetical protein